MKVWKIIVLLGLVLIGLCIYATYIKDWDYDSVNSLYKNPNANLTSIINKMKSNCRVNDADECYALQIKRWIEVNLKYRNDTHLQDFFALDNDVNYTLRNGNDCEGFAVFSATLLHELGVNEIYYIEEDYGNEIIHASIGIKTENGMVIINSEKNMTIKNIRLLS